jgi:hypothetical protein
MWVYKGVQGVSIKGEQLILEGVTKAGVKVNKAGFWCIKRIEV